MVNVDTDLWYGIPTLWGRVLPKNDPFSCMHCGACLAYRSIVRELPPGSGQIATLCCACFEGMNDWPQEEDWEL